jgi:hypothetical protein
MNCSCVHSLNVFRGLLLAGINECGWTMSTSENVALIEKEMNTEIRSNYEVILRVVISKLEFEVEYVGVFQTFFCK